MKKTTLIIISFLLISCSGSFSFFIASAFKTSLKILLVSIIFVVIGALFSVGSKKENEDKKNTNKD